MNLLAVFIVLIPAAVYSSISSKPYLKPRIAEGIPVNIKHFHNQALIKLGPGGRGTCGGIIYDSTTIITAAHWFEIKRFSSNLCTFHALIISPTNSM